MSAHDIHRAMQDAVMVIAAAILILSLLHR